MTVFPLRESVEHEPRQLKHSVDVLDDLGGRETDAIKPADDNPCHQALQTVNAFLLSLIYTQNVFPVDGCDKRL